MIFRQYPFIITKDSNGNHLITCPDFKDFACTINGMTLVEASGAAMCTIHQLCNSLEEQGIPLPAATTLETAKQSAPKDALLVATVIVARKEDGDFNY